MRKNYKARLVDRKVSDHLKTFGAVCIEGPKWCGKTWTCENQASSVFRLADPAGNFQNRELAKIDIGIALSGDFPHLIDEWQEIPELWDAVRYKVDANGMPGQFLLTGSSTPKRKGILHSGAGRISRITMHTLSLYESEDSSGTVSLRDLFNGDLDTCLTGEVSLKHLSDLIIRGGWPAKFAMSPESNLSLLAREYIDAAISDDINRLEDKNRNTDKMRILMKSLARNESTTVSVNTLRSDMKNLDGTSLDDETIADYIGALKRLFLVDNQAPFSPNVRSSVRVKQAEKIHFADPSISCALLGMDSNMLINDLRTFGFMFEALCEHDLRVYAESLDAKLFHYQDYYGKEIDAVVELSDGRWGAFEIKLGTNQIDAAAAGLISIKEDFLKDENSRPPAFLCVICGMSNAAYKRKDGVYVVPITALRD